MNYEKIYHNLITKASERTIVEYTEKHHIIPRCLGGTDEASNLVNLTPEEHYLAHQLLTKIYPSLVRAAVMMTMNRHSNKIYGWLRKKFSKSQSINMSGPRNPQFGTKWIHNTELERSMKISKLDDVPAGWKVGRKLKFETKKCRSCDLPVFTKFSSYCETHSKEVKKKNGIKNRTYLKNSGPDSYKNKRFITNGVVDKLHLLQDPLPDGWKFGRSNNKHRSLD
jgi:hypothetical protein